MNRRHRKFEERDTGFEKNQVCVPDFLNPIPRFDTPVATQSER